MGYWWYSFIYIVKAIAQLQARICSDEVQQEVAKLYKTAGEEEKDVNHRSKATVNNAEVMRRDAMRCDQTRRIG